MWRGDGGGGGGVLFVAALISVRFGGRWTLEVKLGDGQPDRALVVVVGTVVRNFQGYPA